MLSRLKIPLIALVLGVLPYFVFVGTSQTVDVNGVRVTDNQLNVLGIILGVVGLIAVIRFLLSREQRDLAQKVLAAIAALLCALQIAASADLVRPMGLLNDWLNPDSDLPALAYRGPTDGIREIAEFDLNSGDPVIDRIVTRSSFMLDKAHEHMAYAEVCHDARYRIDYDRLVAQSAELPEQRRAEIAERAEGMRRSYPTPENCVLFQTNHSMGQLVDQIHADYDVIDILLQYWRDQQQ